ncbi:hypothetical protein PISL3812_08635 [Talaromyces islandicus]|uniref:Uncharacterized protein n=1 Tax=Talaromyces islandicus TaxID=28573 RepID=A0A0U1M7L6_TALIS|nr:hypothetical protein PISL3812_08635 [Talaromyces islandicus]
MAETTNPDIAAIFSEIVETVSHYVLEIIGDFQDWVATPKIRRWLRIIVVVAGYLMVRPWIELFFRKMFEKQMDKEDAERKKKREEEEGFLAPGMERAKKNANSLRVGGAGEEQEQGSSDEEDEAEKVKASGVMEWGRGARKRQKKAAAKQEALRKAEQMDEEELLQLLDWSESEGEGGKKKAAAAAT